MIDSILPETDFSTSLSPQTNMVSLLFESYPVPSLRAVPRFESIKDLRSGDAEFPRRICSSRVRTSTSKEFFMSAVSHATQIWYFFDGSSFLPTG